MIPPQGTTTEAVIDRHGLQALLDVLADRGYKTVGPTVAQGAVVYDEIRSVSDLPEGWTDFQDGGTYRLERRDDDALFGYAVGPHSWKKFLFPPSTLLARSGPDGDDRLPEDDVPMFAFLGVRACELAAIDVQDRVFLREGAEDPAYAARREKVLLIAVNCGTPAGTCFCVSMDTGPKARSGFDLALTEVMDDGGHRFVVEPGTERGREILEELPRREALAADGEAAERVVAGAAAAMGREMDTDGIKDLLYRNLEHPRWDEVAERCLACGNCTMACPTCFCNSVEDTTDLTGENAERWRRWDSCFTIDFSHVGEGSVRTSTRGRYRQWMTHKLATWIDQFGTSGCVGCGRCITWCPVGIDITEELRAIRMDDGA